MSCRFRSAFVALLLGLPLAAPAVAHHGWSWADAEQVRLEGVIEAISMSPPHPTLRVRDARGTVWQVELGNPGRTERSGFTAETAGIGDAVIVIGNRDADRTQAHMKAVRIVIDGRNYDMYPERIRSD
ncbi:DUF6152 family protein [Paracoccus benzoatiresistens]|uniref:DUF6152 family protein n=1 Tax=Paracoccus benzoatiresistens TaxID=2997341 RepID=A0ABT4IYS7_9RHOB|nr:DUF6152 family protein [Paracoccus sp. EF6]MCZ0960016.1 DUF6152 family protein [Paracoccus sp. EF6]